MTEISELQQQTDEWLAFRSSKIGSSDACIIMGTVDWSTPRKLWEEKLGLSRKRMGKNLATELGNNFEPVARALYELESGLDYEPKIMVSNRYSFMIASLDGYNEETNSILEIKCVQSDVFAEAKAGRVHPKYIPQLQHQLFCAKADYLIFFVAKLEQRQFSREWFIAETAVVKVLPDKEYIKELLIQELGFWGFMASKVPPPLTERDALKVNDEESVRLFERLAKAKEESTAKFKLVKEEVIEFVEAVLKHNKIECGDYSFSKNKNGSWVFRTLSAELPLVNASSAFLSITGGGSAEGQSA